MKAGGRAMNIANKLTVARLIAVPIFMVVMLLPESILSLKNASIIGAIIFIAASITDSLDGHIARKYNLITDFGKFVDPLADKFLVIGALFVILYRFEELRLYVLILTIAVVFRELAVTSARLVASTSSEKVVIPANIYGKIKTVFQIVFISSVLIEHVLWADSFPYLYGYPVSMVAMAGTLVMTLVSGGIYLYHCRKYFDSTK